MVDRIPVHSACSRAEIAETSGVLKESWVLVFFFHVFKTVLLVMKL